MVIQYIWMGDCLYFLQGVLVEKILIISTPEYFAADLYKLGHNIFI